MSLYFGLAAILLVVSSMLSAQRGTWSLVVTVNAVLLTILVGVAFCRKAGTDYSGYSEHYELLASSLSDIYSTNGGWWDQGFLFISWIFLAAHWPYDSLMATCVGISLTACTYVSFKITRNCIAFLFALFCLCFAFIPFVRQDLAASIAFLSFYFAATRRIKIFLALSALAALIHSSAALISTTILASALWERRRAEPKLLMSYTLIGLTMITAFAYQVFYSERFTAQLIDYTADGFVQGLVSEEVSGIRNNIKFGFYMFLVAIFYYGRSGGGRGNKGEFERICIRVILIFSVAAVILAQLTPVFARLSTYLFPFLAIVFVWTLSAARRRRLGVVGAGTLLLLAHLYTALFPSLEWM